MKLSMRVEFFFISSMWPLNIVSMKSTPTVPGRSRVKRQIGLSIQVGTLEPAVFVSCCVCVCVFELSQLSTNKVWWNYKHLGFNICSLPPPVVSSLSNRIRLILEGCICSFFIHCSSFLLLRDRIGVKSTLSCVSLVCNFRQNTWSAILLKSKIFFLLFQKPEDK